MRGFESVKSNNSRDTKREDELFDIYKLSKEAKNEWVTIRLLPGDILPIKKHWISIEGKEGKEIRIPRMCVSFDPDSDDALRGMKCPYCKIPHQSRDNPEAPAQYDFKYFSEAIIRDLQESEPSKKAKLTKHEEKTGFKEAGSKAWTPVRVIPMTKGNVIRINQLAERNMHKDPEGKGKKAYSLTDAKFGCDIEIKFRDEKGVAPGDRYVIEKGDHTPLTKEEKKYLRFDLSDWEGIYDQLGRLDEEGALKDYKKLDVLGMADSDDDEDDDDSMSLGRSKKKGKDAGKESKKSKKSLLDEDEDDEDDKPRKKKGKKSRDEDEDDKPKKKKKRLLDDEDEDDKPKKKKKRLLDDDEDDKPAKKKKKSSDGDKKKKKKSSDDDAPKKKKKKK